MVWSLKYHDQKLKTGQFILSRMYSKTGQAGSSLSYVLNEPFLQKRIFKVDRMILTLNTAASQAQTSHISLRGRLAAELITCQVAVEEKTQRGNTFYLTFHKQERRNLITSSATLTSSSDFLLRRQKAKRKN